MKEACTGSRMRTISICMMHTRTHKLHTHASHTNYTHTHHTHTHHTQTTHTQTTHTHLACHSHAAKELHVWTYERSLHWITHAYNLNLYDAHTHTQTTHTYEHPSANGWPQTHAHINTHTHNYTSNYTDAIIPAIIQTRLYLQLYRQNTLVFTEQGLTQTRLRM